MGLTVAGTELITGSGVGGLSATTADGTAVGSVFTTVALIYALAYFDLLDAVDGRYEQIRRMLLILIVPLCVVFVSIILMEVARVA